MQAQRATDQEPIPGYRLLEPLGKGGFGEVWKCEAPGGLFKAIKFVRAASALEKSCAAEQELRALQHVKSIRHPFLLSLERVEHLDGDLVIIMELADRSLHDLLEQHKTEGRPGIPRDEVLAYLRETAEVLDLMNREHNLQHLDVKPRNLFLVGRHVKVADFGLVSSIAETFSDHDDGRPDLVGAITPQYAAPETFEDRATLYSDQYSLAVTYQELVTGKLPYPGYSVRQLLLAATCDGHQPDLSPLPEADRPVVARALSKEPEDRFETCLAFIEALEQASPPDEPSRTRTRTTSFDFTLSDTDNMTPPSREKSPDGSGLLRRNKAAVTQTARVVTTASSSGGGAALSDYQLQESLSRGTLGELWRATGPGGQPHLVRFLSMADVQFAGDTLDRLAAMRHPVLPKVRLLDAGAGRVAVITAAGDSSLAACLKESQTAGLPGIPRQELLVWMAKFAKALDEVYQRHQIQHLALSPRHLALSRGEPLLLEFGLAELLMLPQGAQPGALNPRYAAVELFDGLVSEACDQYSLALIYQELLVGLHPFRNLNARQLGSAKLRGLPELSLLPAPDRVVVMQALSPEPEQRFTSCREFVAALEAISGFMPAVAPSRGGGTHPMPVLVTSANHNEWAAALEEIVNGAAQGHLIQAPKGQTPYRLTPGVEIEQHVMARLPAGMVKLKVASFCEQQKATVLQKSERRWLVEIAPRTTLLQRWMGRQPSLLVEVAIGRPREAVGTNGELTPLRVRLEPHDCSRGKAEQFLDSMAPTVLTSIQTLFSGQSSKKAQERYPLAQAVQVQTSNGLSVTGQTRDVGREEMALVVPCELPLGPVKLTINRWGSQMTVQVPGRVRDCVAGSDEGQWEIDVVLG